MVSYYDSLSYQQKHHATNLSYPSSAAHQAWFPTNYHPHSAANQQFLNGMTGPSDHAAHLNHQHQAAAAAAMYYNSHMFHQGTPPTQPPPPPPPHHDLYGTRDNYQYFSSNTASSVHHMQPPPPLPSSGFYHPHHSHTNGLQSNNAYSTHTHFGINGGGSPLDETSSSADVLTDGIPSPPNTTGSGGSGINSPGVPNASSSPHLPNRNTSLSTSTPTDIGQKANNNNNNNNNTQQNNNSQQNNNNNHNNNIDDDESIDGNEENKTKSKSNDKEYYDWMKKLSYPSQPNPGKTRTKDKYRVVYTEYQRLELEKEYHTSRYITIRRKNELAQGLQLSERQIKIWFQNRRAKERKQTKKRDDPIGPGNQSAANTVADDLSQFLDIKPKLESNDYSHNSFHPQLCPVSMGPPPPPPNMLNPFPVLPPHAHPHQGHHLSIGSNGQNGMLSQPSSAATNQMQHAYTQMLQSMIEPIA